SPPRVLRKASSTSSIFRACQGSSAPSSPDGYPLSATLFIGCPVSAIGGGSDAARFRFIEKQLDDHCVRSGLRGFDCEAELPRHPQHAVVVPQHIAEHTANSRRARVIEYLRHQRITEAAAFHVASHHHCVFRVFTVRVRAQPHRTQHLGGTGLQGDESHFS